MKTEKLREIVSNFINCKPVDVDNDTLIDSNSLGGSLLTARFYAEISKNGFKIDNYWKINTFGELLKALQIDDEKIYSREVSIPVNGEFIKKKGAEKLKFDKNIGIDIETLNNFPESPDYWTDEFYIRNFSEKEISYCCKKSNPKECFAGKFAAKEAIIKLLWNENNILLNEIEILNKVDGSPYFNEGVSISISHSAGNAIAVAMVKESYRKNKNENVKVIGIGDEIKNIGIKKKQWKRSIFLISMVLFIISITLNLLYFKEVL